MDPLKFAGQDADTHKVRLSRLVIEGNQNRVALSLHPRLTVVAGVPAPVRAHLVDEIIGGFTGSRSGVHIELVNGSGRRITVVRPHDGPHQVTVPDEKIDLTDDFLDASGRTDVLARYGLDSAAADQILHVGSDATCTITPADAHIARLSCIPQPALWSAAARVQVTQAEFQALNDEIAANDDRDSQVVADVEKRHQTVEAAVGRQQQIETHLVRLAMFSLIAAVALSMRSRDLGLVLVCIAAASAAIALFLRGKVEDARRREDAAVATAGGSSYLGFVVAQVNGLMEDTAKRRRLAGVATDHRNAAIAWTRLAGDVTIDWALAHQAEVEAAAKLHHQMEIDPSATATDMSERTAAIARIVLGRMAELRRIGYGSESFPLLLDEPFADLDPRARVALLELIARSAGSPQVVLLTAQADIADWARLRSATGEVALLAPLGPTSPPDRRSDAADDPPPGSDVQTATSPPTDDQPAYGNARTLAG